jgi:DNA-binding response OmpR family regulator
VLLDVMLPGENGFALCSKIRPYYSGPLLFMTAKNDDYDQILGLEIGADDYVIKPVEPRVLLARINALLRRNVSSTPSSQTAEILQFGQLTINRATRAAYLKGKDVQLTSHEFDMLWKLAENPSTLIERSTLYTEVIGREYDGLDRSADVRISRLRKKLQDNAQHPYKIKTIWGKGFFFVADAWDE